MSQDTIPPSPRALGTSNLALPRSENVPDRKIESTRSLGAMNNQQFDVMALQAFDLARDNILSHPTPPIRIGNDASRSTTYSVYRLRWNWLAEWNHFGGRVQHYWNNIVTQVDKQAHVYTTGAYRDIVQDIVQTHAFINETSIKDRTAVFIVPVHNAAATGRNGAPLPADQHSCITLWGPDRRSNQLAGVPDLVMENAEQNDSPITVLFETKDAWQVVPMGIDEVIDDVAPVDGIHPARLAVEQLYGYMVRNAKVFGVLSTMKGWCFLRRVNGGGLYITRMFGDFFPVANVSDGAAAERYYPTNDFTIMQALYYLSSIAHGTADLPETPINGVPGQVSLPRAVSDSSAASSIQQPPPPSPPPEQPLPMGYNGYYPQGYYQVVDRYDEAECIQYDNDSDYRLLQFEPWKPENVLGPKTWIVNLVPNTKLKVVCKLWDAWNYDPTDRDREAQIYLHLKPLWGVWIPALRVKTALEFFHALILQYVEASPVSPANLTATVESRVLEAYARIHALRVLHFDIRRENILVGKDERVWIVDFEFSAVITDEVEFEACKEVEMRLVRDILTEVKCSKPRVNGARKNVALKEMTENRGCN